MPEMPALFRPDQADVDALIRTAQLPAISKATLQTICSVNGLAKGGNKADLQNRIIALVNECVAQNDLQRLSEVRRSVYDHAPVRSQQYNNNQTVQQQYYTPPTVPPTAPVAPLTMSQNNFGNGYGVANGQRPGFSTIQQSFQYKRSPFYEMKNRIGVVHTCDIMKDHRNCVTINIRLQDHAALAPCLTDPSMRVMAFCAPGNTGIQEIAFPQQSELKVNGGDVKANLRGLKNKPGSTRPVDITDLLRFRPATYSNTVDFTYALTKTVGPQPITVRKSRAKPTRKRDLPVTHQFENHPANSDRSQKYYFGIYVCKSTSIDGLVEQIGKGKRISKSSVIQEIAKKASDPDVVATSQNLSLKCPLSYMRLKNPCRGPNCSHIQCFDATSYLQLQQQGPQWICPICNHPAPFEQLAIDDYVKDILENTSQSLEQVTIEPNGKWSVQSSHNEDIDDSEGKEASYLDDDDLVISETSFVSSRNTATPNRSGAVFGTPLGDSREGSTMPRSVPSTNKRSHSDIIDLTLSDDDDAPNPPPKRKNLGTNGWNTGAY